MANKRVGSGFDDLLREEGVLETFQVKAIKEVIAWQLGQAMKDQNLSKRKLAALMHTSRTQVDRVLDPTDGSRSERYSYIPTAAVLTKLRAEGFQPFMVCQTRVRDAGKREHTKHLLRLRHASQINGREANEIILLNSHDGSSTYIMLILICHQTQIGLKF